MHANGDTWRRWYQPGAVKDCPLTGYCFDDDCLDALKKEAREGATLKEAFERLADLAQETLESECEYQRSEEAFKEWVAGEGCIFRRDGSRDC